MMALNEEYKKRYNHTDDHVTIQKLGELLAHPPKNAKINKIATDPQPAMPEHCKVDGDAVASYRNYYILEKKRFATWKSPAKIPEWYKEGKIYGNEEEEQYIYSAFHERIDRFSERGTDVVSSMERERHEHVPFKGSFGCNEPHALEPYY